MSEAAGGSGDLDFDALKARNLELEARLRENEEHGRQKLIRAELKAHAVRAGIVDLDGLKLVETDGLTLNDSGELDGAANLMSSLKKKKPWLFGEANSSSTALPPPSAPLKKKLATDMSVEEWRTARADILRHR